MYTERVELNGLVVLHLYFDLEALKLNQSNDELFLLRFKTND